jgi:8-oxo-dGTP pyrophosphatase MutT (NUDIX family)
MTFPRAFQCYRPRDQKVFGVIAISKDNRVLLVKGRVANKWSFPKGHIQERETSFDCAHRECYEETGINYKELDCESHKKLSSGSYFIYKNMDEEVPIIQDCNEVSDVAWVSIPSMMNMRTNVDVSRFLELYRNYM